MPDTEQVRMAPGGFWWRANAFMIDVLLVVGVLFLAAIPAYEMTGGRVLPTVPFLSYYQPEVTVVRKGLLAIGPDGPVRERVLLAEGRSYGYWTKYSYAFIRTGTRNGEDWRDVEIVPAYFDPARGSPRGGFVLESGDAAFGAVFLFHFLCEWLLGGLTPGKAIMRMRVVGPDGARPGLPRSLWRNLVKVVSIGALCVGAAMALLTRRQQALHDLAARTLVVSTARERAGHPTGREGS